MTFEGIFDLTVDLSVFFLFDFLGTRKTTHPSRKFFPSRFFPNGRGHTEPNGGSGNISSTLFSMGALGGYTCFALSPNVCVVCVRCGILTSYFCAFGPIVFILESFFCFVFIALKHWGGSVGVGVLVLECWC